eukprot:3910027-Amphidinium_carterae.1
MEQRSTGILVDIPVFLLLSSGFLYQLCKTLSSEFERTRSIWKSVGCKSELLDANCTLFPHGMVCSQSRSGATVSTNQVRGNDVLKSKLCMTGFGKSPGSTVGGSSEYTF